MTHRIILDQAITVPRSEEHDELWRTRVVPLLEDPQLIYWISYGASDPYIQKPGGMLLSTCSRADPQLWVRFPMQSVFSTLSPVETDP